MRLNLGSATQKIPGFSNVDHRPGKGVDIVDDAFELKTVKSNSAEEIIASHLLEHACFDRTEAVLRRWRDVLVPGGKLWVAVPNFELVMKNHFNNYKKGKTTWEYFNSRIFGNAKVARRMYGEGFLSDMDGIYKYEMAFHRAVFDSEMLESMMVRAGFKKVRIVKALPFEGKSAHSHEICCVGSKS